MLLVLVYPYDHGRRRDKHYYSRADLHRVIRRGLDAEELEYEAESRIRGYVSEQSVLFTEKLQVNKGRRAESEFQFRGRHAVQPAATTRIYATYTGDTRKSRERRRGHVYAGLFYTKDEKERGRQRGKINGGKEILPAYITQQP